jgi:hypothetical protein
LRRHIASATASTRRRPPRRSIDRALGHAGGWSVRGVVAVCCVVQFGWVATFFVLDHDVRDLIRIGPRYIGASHRSQAIRSDPGYTPPPNQDSNRAGEGYDGQFYYYLALDPPNARFYMDSPGYRYLRPVYPALARAAALGQRAAIPWTLLIVNLAAVVGATALLGRYLRRRDTPPAYALLYGIAPGALLAVQRDLTEPVAFLLVAGAIAALDSDRRAAWLLSAALLALAFLTRQPAAAFVAPLALALLSGRGGGGGEPTGPTRFGRRLWVTAGFVALAVGPYIAYAAAIAAWVGPPRGPEQFTLVPFGGFFGGPDGFALARQGVSLLTVAAPVTAWLAAAVALRRARADSWIALVAVAASAVPFVILDIDTNAYTARGRGALGVALALVLLAPSLAAAGPRVRRLVLWGGAAWLAMLPVVAVYGLSGAG